MTKRKEMDEETREKADTVYRPCYCNTFLLFLLYLILIPSIPIVFPKPGQAPYISLAKSLQVYFLSILQHTASLSESQVTNIDIITSIICFPITSSSSLPLSITPIHPTPSSIFHLLNNILACFLSLIQSIQSIPIHSD